MPSYQLIPPTGAVERCGDPAAQYRGAKITGGGGCLLEPSHAPLAQAIRLQTGCHLTNILPQTLLNKFFSRLGGGWVLVVPFWPPMSPPPSFTASQVSFLQQVHFCF